MFRKGDHPIRTFLLFTLAGGIFASSSAGFSQSNIISDNILVGPGASGLGGAYTAVADDPTAIIYNPAGLVHITTNKRSLSYNAYMTATYSVDKIIFNSKWKSEGNFTPFFAGTSYRNATILPEWTFAGAAYDRGIYSARRRWNASGKESIPSVDTSEVDGSYEAVSRQSGSALTVAGAAARSTAFGSIGFSVGIRSETESSQEFSKFHMGPFDSNGKDRYSDVTSNTDREAKGYAVELGIGGLWKKDDWTFGASISQVNFKSQKGESIEDSTYATTNADGQPATTRVGDYDVSIPVSREQEKISDNHPFGRPPVRYRLGVAHHLTESTRWSTDIIGRGYSHTEHSRIQPGADLALGIETQITGSFFTRFGAFNMTDQANTLSSDGYHRADSYVDSLGVTSMLMYLAKGWSLSLGALYQQGQGKSGGTGLVARDVEVKVTSFSASFTSDQ